MKTDTEKLLMRITRTQKYVHNVAENNVARQWEDSRHPIQDIMNWSMENGYEPSEELYFQGRQAGRIAMAREVLQILGRPLEADEGGLLTYEESKKLVEKIERLQEALIAAKACINDKAYTAAVMVIDTALNYKETE